MNVDGSSSRARLALSSALVVGSAGAYMPFVALLLDRLDWSGRAVGGMLALMALVRTLANPVCGALADRTLRDDRLLAALSAGAALAILVAASATSPPVVVVALVGVAAMRTPAMVVLDAGIIRTLIAQGAGVIGYGPIRMWGSVAYLMTATAAGLLATWSTSLAVGLAAVVLLAASATTPRFSPRAGAPPPDLRQAVSLVLADPALRMLFLLALLHGASLSVYDSWLPMLLEERGWSTGWTGLAITLGVGAEIGALAGSKPLLERFSTRKVLVAAGLASATRLVVVALAPSLVAVLGIQLLHGLAMGLWWAALVKLVQDRAAPEVRASAQALTLSAAYGLGPALTSLTAALVLDDHGVRGLFLAGAAIALLAAAMVPQERSAARPLPVQTPSRRAA